MRKRACWESHLFFSANAEAIAHNPTETGSILFFFEARSDDVDEVSCTNILFEGRGPPMSKREKKSEATFKIS